eukprot:3199129-Prorocentrum_lima.AAC.1
METLQVLQTLHNIKQDEERQLTPNPIWTDGLYQPHGGPVPWLTEGAQMNYSCLYEQFATFLGLEAETHPISLVKKHCAEHLWKHADYFWP